MTKHLTFDHFFHKKYFITRAVNKNHVLIIIKKKTFLTSIFYITEIKVL